MTSLESTGNDEVSWLPVWKSAHDQLSSAPSWETGDQRMSAPLLGRLWVDSGGEGYGETTGQQGSVSQGYGGRALPRKPGGGVHP